MHSARLLAQAVGFRFIDAPAAADGPLLKGSDVVSLLATATNRIRAFPAWRDRRSSRHRPLPVYAGWCISVFGAPLLYRNVRLAESVVRS
jgi:hypothetical protein